MGNEGNDTSAATRSPHSPHSPLDITTIPLDDPATYKLFARGDTVAVFQFESRGMRELLKRAQPDRFEDLIALNRSEERRVGKECVSTCRSWWTRYNQKHKQMKTT